MVECQSCGGRYEPILPDGMQYFHACPPLSAGELQAAVDAGAAKLPAGETADVAVQRRTYERADKRDENVVRPVAGSGAAGIKAEGAGVLVVADVDQAPVVVVVPVKVGKL